MTQNQTQSEAQPAAAKPVVLTGAQPTGRLHLGNYLGAALNWKKMQDDYTCFFMIANQHAITVPTVPAELRKNTYSCLAQYMACGLDPKKSSLFAQSQVIGHTELAWLLSCICPLGQLERMTQFKDKAKKQISVGAGLLYYPALMAADILLYNANVVPVGEDQKQHLEITRDLAEKFNATYSPTFNVPEAFIGSAGARVMSLQNPTAKMSKSDPNQAGTVYIVDSDDVIRKKIMSAVTDSDGSIRVDAENKPGITNLISIYASVTGTPVQRVVDEFSGKGYGDFKKAVADAVVAMLAPIRTRYEELISQKEILDETLKSGAAAAQRVANKTMAKVYRKVGFVS